MAKLIVEITRQFRVGLIRALHQGERKTLDASRIREITTTSGPTDFSLDTVFRNVSDNTLWAQIDVSLNPKRKSDVFVWQIDEEAALAEVTVSAKLISKSLRAGVAQRIHELGSNFEVRLAGFNYNGGRWSGLEAPVIGQNEEGDFDRWFKIDQWSISK